MKALLKTILSGFIGIKRAQSAEQELPSLRPVQLILVALLCLASFIGLIFLLVKVVMYLSVSN